MRCFLSVDLPTSLAEVVADAQALFDGCAGLRLTDSTQAHCTLAFLGDTDPGRIAEIEAALETAVTNAGVDPFDCAVIGLGVFPSMAYISVIWAGVREGAGNAELTTLAAAVEDELTVIGFDPADHEFTPHITLARMDTPHNEQRVQRLVDETDPTTGAFQVERLRLSKSTLTDDRSAYETVSAVRL